MGGGVLVGSFLSAQGLIQGCELPLGAVTALIGAPYFLYLLYRTNRQGVGG